MTEVGQSDTILWSREIMQGNNATTMLPVTGGMFCHSVYVMQPSKCFIEDSIKASLKTIKASLKTIKGSLLKTQ